MKQTIFDQFADFITSIKAVIIALIFLLLFLMIETQTLFNRQLPSDVFPFLRVMGSFAVAITYEFTVLIFTANSHKKGGVVPVMLAIFHFFINCYFWQAWDFASHRDMIDTAYRFFLSGLFSYLGFIYANLFVSKYEERKNQISGSIKIADLESQLADSIKQINELANSRDHIAKIKDELLSANSQLTSSISDLSSANDQLKSKVGQLQSDYNELKLKFDQASKDRDQLASTYQKVAAELNDKRQKLSRKTVPDPVPTLSDLLGKPNNGLSKLLKK